MTTMNISVPEPMKDWVKAQIDAGNYASSSDYVRDLIRKDQQDKNKLAALQSAITQGIKSGHAGELDMKAIKQKARQLAELENP
ncbi:MAG: type II toxin-antitoxin system ParD family antitoxin [Gammaproteobacteria bacterium]|nr:type II toxin-antitoxin system ParD family antitoxin [Gammaproteobacteria bacterium]MCY4339316.1 type II toxin-antitoxin system ParD family antitoxin [Gammaproteobacteria bacterium]